MGVNNRTVSIRPNAMTTLNNGFERDLQEAVLADAESRLREELGPRVERLSRERWRQYATPGGS